MISASDKCCEENETVVKRLGIDWMIKENQFDKLVVSFWLSFPITI